MKLIKLEINNFRQFYGKQCIEFSVDKRKSVTLIHGENNGGKTALLNALRWCLYEETTDNLQNPHNLINKHALKNGVNSFSVNIHLLHDNRLFEVKRTGFHSNQTSIIKIFEIIDGCYAEKNEKYPNTLINSFLPKEMTEYFFYQGEGTGTLSSQNDFSHIKDAISKVLGLTIAEKTLTHLLKIKSDYQKDLTKYDTGNHIKHLLSNKRNLESMLSNNETALSRKSLALKEADKEYDEQTKQLWRFDKTVIEEKIRNRARQEKFLSSLKITRDSSLKNKAKQTSDWINKVYSKKLGTIDISQIDIQELNVSHRYTVDKPLIHAILKNHRCICGTTVEENSAVAEIILALEKSAVDPALKARWLKAKKLHEKISHDLSPKQEMMNILSEIDDNEDSIIDTEKNIEELNHSIIESNVDNIRIIENKRNEAKKNCDHLRNTIMDLKRQINNLNIDLKDIDKEINSCALSQPKAIRIKNYINFLEEIFEIYQAAIDSSKNGVDSILLQKMQILFSRVAFTGYTVKKNVSLNKSDNFTWIIVDKEGKPASPGNGYQAMLAISFVIALIQFSKERANSKQHLLTPGTVAPFIADSILAFIGPDNGRELVRFIAESVEQSIFMLSQSQWTETHTDRGIRDKIGKEYNLVQHTVLTKDEFEGSYPTKLSISGQQFDVVHFGSDFDRVTIEEIPLNE